MVKWNFAEYFAARIYLKLNVESELNVQHSLTIEAIDCKGRRARLETLTKNDKEVCSSAVEKNGYLGTSATRATKKEETLQSLINWLKDSISAYESFETTKRNTLTLWLK